MDLVVERDLHGVAADFIEREVDRGNERKVHLRWHLLRRCGGTHIELTTHAPTPVRLRLARFAFPGWRVAIDGAPATWAPSRWGSLELEVPAGDARVEVWLEPPPLRRAGLWLSALAGVAWVAGLAAARRRARASVASRG